jgi:hypothetical protein
MIVTKMAVSSSHSFRSSAMPSAFLTLTLGRRVLSPALHFFATDESASYQPRMNANVRE